MQECIGFFAQNSSVLAWNVVKRIRKCWINQQKSRTRVLNDVQDFFGAEPKVDGHQDATRRGHAVKC